MATQKAQIVECWSDGCPSRTSLHTPSLELSQRFRGESVCFSKSFPLNLPQEDSSQGGEISQQLQKEFGHT